MAEEKNIDLLVSMQQEICDMWGINNQTKYVFYYDESNNCRKFGLMIVSSSLIRIIQPTLCWQD